MLLDNVIYLSGRLTSVGKALSFTHELSFLLFYFLINTSHSAAAHLMAIRCILEVRLQVKLQQLV